MLPLSVWQMLVGRPTPRISLPGLANCTRCGVVLFNPGGTRDTISQNTKESHPCSYSYSALRYSYSYSRLNIHDRVRVGVPGYALSTSTITMLTCGTATLSLPPSIVLVLSTAVLVVSVLNTISAHSYGVALFSASGTRLYHFLADGSFRYSKAASNTVSRSC